MMKGIRWVVWLPLALVASVVTGGIAVIIGAWFSQFVEGSAWYTSSVSGAVSAWAFFYVALRVAPNPSAGVKWIAVGVVGVIGVLAALGPLLNGTEPIRALTGAVMAGFAIYYARLPIDAIRADVDAT